MKCRYFSRKNLPTGGWNHPIQMPLAVNKDDAMKPDPLVLLHHSHEMEALCEALSHIEDLKRNFVFIFYINKESKDILEIMNNHYV